ncbi:MAG TPA: SIMPL domain-containing protein [Burkholderiaceae bacterium]|nr:SIMPL domain-containing protein [Burkholderiaceae bacterium]
MASRVLARCIVSAFMLLPAVAVAQAPPPAPPAARPEGTLVIISGSGEIDVANDEAVANLYVELQDADLARAQSLVNQRAAEGVAQLKRGDPKAQIETSGYASYPVYARDAAKKVVGWRVRQSVSFRTSELSTLGHTLASAQQQLAVAGLEFRLSRAARERVEAELIQRAIANLNTRIAAAAQALDVPKSRVRIEELNFGGAGNERPPIVPVARAMVQSAEAGVEPQYDPGRTTQQLSVVARVRFAAAN